MVIVQPSTPVFLGFESRKSCSGILWSCSGPGECVRQEPPCWDQLSGGHLHLERQVLSRRHVAIDRHQPGSPPLKKRRILKGLPDTKAVASDGQSIPVRGVQNGRGARTTDAEKSVECRRSRRRLGPAVAEQSLMQSELRQQLVFGIDQVSCCRLALSLQAVPLLEVILAQLLSTDLSSTRASTQVSAGSVVCDRGRVDARVRRSRRTLRKTPRRLELVREPPQSPLCSPLSCCSHHL